MMSRLLRRVFTADVMGLLLVVIALQTLVYGVASSLRTTDTTYFFYVGLVAALLGFGLGQSRFNGIQASAGIAALGVVGVWIIGAGLARPLGALIRAATSLIPQWIAYLRFDIPVDATPLLDTWTPIVESSAALWMRLQTWWLGFSRNVSINDALIRNLVWLLILWCMAAWMGWFASRRNAIAALLPGIALLAWVTAYSERRYETLWLLVFALLLLMGVWSYRNNTSRWEKLRVDYSESIPFDVTQAVIALSMLVASLAFITPSVSWRDVRDFFRELNESSEDEAADLLGIQRPAGAPGGAPTQTPSLPRDHLLDAGVANSEEIVMIVKTGELPPVPSTVTMLSAPRYYWRSTIYDRYMGAGWETTSAPSQSIPPNTPLIPGLLSGYRSVTLDVELLQPDGQLYWSGLLYAADVPFIVNWRLRPQSNLFADRTALLQADMFAIATKATGYQAQVYLPIVTVDEMRDAPAEYPADIAERYLQLPRELPGRVRNLARDITRGLDTPYQKAGAIEQYLRATYPYDLNVPAPPPNRDVADYFLFDLKKGYCDYYATAMVVLLRASGVPARFVSGYAPGAYDAPNAQYIIRELNAHSWVEVYFPQIGWVEFEPTASEPEIARAAPEELAQALEQSRTPAQKFLIRFGLENAIYWLAPLSALLVVALVYFTLVERWLVLRLSPALAIESLTRRMYRYGRPLAGGYRRAETAQEFLDKLSQRLTELGGHPRFAKTMTHAQSEAQTLTGLYQSALFRRSSAQKKDAQEAWKIWKRLRRRLLFARALMFITKKTAEVDTNQ